MRYVAPPFLASIRWSITANELGNFTYNISDRNLRYLLHAAATVSGCKLSTLEGYASELMSNRVVIESGLPGRRIGWYVFARLLKPRLIVETGVDRGLGSVVLCEALLMNAREGFDGRYIGTDINQCAGKLMRPEHDAVGHILYGDSLESLKTLSGPIDLFINDSDHSADYEYREYQTVYPKLSSTAMIIGDNSHSSNSLMRFSEETGRKFLFFKEEPDNHWYPGAGIGISVTSLSNNHQ
jgi:hypothetical protein